MVTDKSTSFGDALRTAALADYYMIAEQLGASDDREIIASRPVALAFIELFDLIGVQCEGVIDEQNEMFIHLIFKTALEKSAVDKYFTNYNFAIRPDFGILMPDIYEGQPTPVEQVHQQYFTTIHHYLTPGSGRPLRIPIGKDFDRIKGAIKPEALEQYDDFNEKRAGRTIHAEYAEHGLQGFTYFNNW